MVACSAVACLCPWQRTLFGQRPATGYRQPQPRTGSSQLAVCSCLDSLVPSDPSPRISPYWVLGIALLGISFAGPLVKLSRADPIAIAVWRLGFALCIVA